MQKQQSNPPIKRQSSKQQKKGEKKQLGSLKLQGKMSSSEGEASHLIELKEKGKKVLKKLIPNDKIIKIKKLMQKGAGNIKKEIKGNQKLLPSLTTANIIEELVQETQQNHFSQINSEITSNMVDLQQNITENLQNSDMAEIVRLQTDKCYRKIPSIYFQENIQDKLREILTRDQGRVDDLIMDLQDYYVQVDFNVNQQVSYKLSIFMTFVTFLTSIGQLAQLSINKIKGTRQKNRILKEIIVQKSQRVNYLRYRKGEIQLIMKVLQKLKKMKKIEDWFMNQVQTKGKITSLSSYPQYCQLHQQLKSYCCPRALCKYFDVAYYIQRGYHDSFCRQLKSYLTDIIQIDQKNIQQLIRPNKNSFASVTNGKLFSSLSDPSINLDQSFEIDDQEVQLVSKHNIQKEIVSIFKQGLHKCTYSTDQICQEIKNCLEGCEDRFYRAVRGDHSTNMDKELSKNDKKLIFQKISGLKFVKLVQYWSQRMKKIAKRQIAIVQRALRATKQIQESQPEKYQVICSYLMQIIYITFGFIDESLSFLITCKKFKSKDSQTIRQVLLYQEQWKQLVSDLKLSQFIWEQLQIHFEEEGENNHQQGKIIDGLIGGLRNSRRKMLQIMINGFSSSALQNLEAQLKEENWKTVAMPAKLYRIVGEVVFGKVFTKDLQRSQMKLLSSSLLLDKNSSTYSITNFKEQTPQKTKSQEQIASIYDISLSQTFLKLHNREYKLIYSTISVIQTIQGFLEWVDESSDTEKIEHVIFKKIEQYLLAYNTQVRDLILNKNALNYGKINTKAITAKHLLNTYSQLNFVKNVCESIAKRYPRFVEEAQLVKDRISRHLVEVNKKFIQILQLSIRESINKMVVDPRQQIKWPIAATAQIVDALTRCRRIVMETLLSDEQMIHFIGVEWCKEYLQKLKTQYKSVYKQIMNSNGTRKAKDIEWSDNIYWKYRQLTYLVQNLIDMRDYLPGFQLICQELQRQRNKLEHPS